MGEPEQVASANSWNVTVPVGAGRFAGPVTVATSEIGCPTVAVWVACVVMVAVAWPTTEVSFGAPQTPVTGE
jgi:hypothetical protein